MKPMQLHFEPLSGAFTRRGWAGASAATRWQRWLLAGVLGLVTMACGGLALRLWALQTALAQSTAALQSMRTDHTTVQKAHAVAPPALPASEHAAWARLAGALNTPWNGVFDTLERSIPADVALISIEPDAAKASLRLEAEAATLDVLLRGAQALAQADGVARMVLVKHETQEQQPGSPVRLVVDLQLRRGSP